jgi:hypothetical protein
VIDRVTTINIRIPSGRWDLLEVLFPLRYEDFGPRQRMESSRTHTQSTSAEKWWQWPESGKLRCSRWPKTFEETVVMGCDGSTLDS